MAQTVKPQTIDFNEQFHQKIVKLQYISHRYTIHEKEQDVFSAKFSPDQSYLATCYSDGSISIYSGMHGDKLYYLKDEEINFPLTSIAWKPTNIQASEVQTFKAVGADGRIVHWRPKTGNNMKTVIVSETNSYQCVDYSPNQGQRFAAAGKLPIIEIFDDTKMQKIVDMKSVGTQGHTNRIFCVKFDPVNPNIIFSGGWDRNVNVWDIRNSKCVATLFGPQICGDAIDIKNDGNLILTGSHQVKEGLQLWDLRTLESYKSISWCDKGSEEVCKVFTAKFVQPKKDYIFAGGAERNSAKVFSVETGNVVEQFTSIAKPVLSVDVATDGSLALMGCSDGVIQVKNLVYSQ